MAPKVIKGNAPVDSGAASNAVLGDRKVIDRRVFDAKQKAAEIKKEAEIRAEARRQEGERQVQEAYDKSFAEGRREGEQKAALVAIESYWRRAETLREAGEDCIAIAKQIGAKILGPLTLRDADVAEIGRQEIELAAERRHLRFDFPTGELERLRREAAKLWQALERHPEFHVDSSPELAPNTVVVHSDVGDMISPQDRVEAHLRNLLQLEPENQNTDALSQGDPN